MCDVARVVRDTAGRGAGVRAALVVVATREPGGREDTEAVNCLGLGVTLWSRDGKRVLRCCVTDGVLAAVAALAGREASDMGGEGGSS